MTFRPIHRAGGVSPETELLLRASRPAADAANDARVGSLLRGPLDWDSVIGAARRHGTVPLLSRCLGRLNWDAVPARVRASLREEDRRNAVLNLTRTAELLRILGRFRERGIPALPFKGPTLAAYAYGDLSLRQFNDLDLLLRPRDLAAGRAVLLEDGYAPHLELPAARQAEHLRNLGQVPCYRARDASLVELHSRLFPKRFHFPLGIRELWPRVEPLRLQGEWVNVLSAEDLLLLLSAHGAKHLFACLGWIADIAALLNSRPALDLGAALDRARALRAERLLLLGLRLGFDLLGTAAPDLVERRLHRDPVARRLASEVWGWITGGAPGEVRGAFFHARAREHPRDGVNYAASLVFQPVAADWKFLPLPAAASALYFALRPARLAWKYGTRLLARPGPASGAAGVPGTRRTE